MESFEEVTNSKERKLDQKWSGMFKQPVMPIFSAVKFLPGVQANLDRNRNTIKISKGLHINMLL